MNLEEFLIWVTKKTRDTAAISIIHIWPDNNFFGYITAHPNKTEIRLVESDVFDNVVSVLADMEKRISEGRHERL